MAFPKYTIRLETAIAIFQDTGIGFEEICINGGDVVGYRSTGAIAIEDRALTTLVRRVVAQLWEKGERYQMEARDNVVALKSRKDAIP